jgi:hypothetical protein
MERTAKGIRQALVGSWRGYRCSRSHEHCGNVAAVGPAGICATDLLDSLCIVAACAGEEGCSRGLAPSVGSRNMLTRRRWRKRHGNAASAPHPENWNFRVRPLFHGMET